MGIPMSVVPKGEVVIIHLSESNLERIAAESERRRSRTATSGEMDHTSNGSRSASEMGVIGEWCVSIMTGYKPSEFRYEGQGKAKDVGPLQVRATNRSVLYFKDFEDTMDPLVAVKIIDRNTAMVVGWMFGFECMKSEYKRSLYLDKDMRPGQLCWWEVPHEKLYPFESLENWCVSHGFGKWPAKKEIA